jgi:hypothetical protein
VSVMVFFFLIGCFCNFVGVGTAGLLQTKVTKLKVFFFFFFEVLWINNLVKTLIIFILSLVFTILALIH